MRFKFITETLVYEYASSGDSAFAPGALAAGEWRVMNARGIPAVFGGDPSRLERFRRFAAAHHTGLLLVRDGQWVAYGWCSNLKSPGPPHLPRSVSTLGAYWIFGCHTRTQFRGQGIYKELLARLIALASKDNSSPRIYIDTHADNIPSRRAIISTGFKPRGVFSTYKMWTPISGYRILGGRWRRQEPHPEFAGEDVIAPPEPVAHGISYRNFAG